MEASIRKVYIGGNWKCNGDLKFSKEHCDFLNGIEFDENKCEVAVCPTSLHLTTVRGYLASRYIVASQNISMFDNGAYTGEISSKMLIDSNIHWTLLGHSERRQYFHDDEGVLAKKLNQALQHGVNVIYCVGERLAEREANQTMDVVKTQLETLVKNVTDWTKIVVAYEPVWAIGTGKTASPQQAQEVHNEIRSYLNTAVNSEVASSVRIIYGGSVTDTNANDLILEKDIDGFLVGGASLKSGFKTIIQSYVNKFK
jgi:triosephosphate isomerase